MSEPHHHHHKESPAVAVPDAIDVTIPDGRYMVQNVGDDSVIAAQQGTNPYVVCVPRDAQSIKGAPLQWDVKYDSQKKAYSFKNVATGVYLTGDQLAGGWQGRTTLFYASDPYYFRLQRGTRVASYYIAPQGYSPQVLDWSSAVTIYRVNDPPEPNSKNQQWTFGVVALDDN